MVGAALSRRAGLGSAATALALAVAAGGCGVQARHTPPHKHARAHPTAVEPEPISVSLPRLPGGLPWPVVLRTADGAYVIGRNGAIHVLRPTPRPRAQAQRPAGFIWVNRHADTWATVRRGRLVIVRNRAVIWQSAARYAVKDAAHMADILVGRQGVAFQVHMFGPWFIAGWQGREHLVATAGWPEMWTRSGNLIVLLHRRGSKGFGYAVFSPSGTRLATLATGLSVWRAGQRYDDQSTGTFWYLTSSGDLRRTDGAATRVIASTRALGFISAPEVGILSGGLIQLLSVSANSRGGQVVLYPDGHLYARIPAPRRQMTGSGLLSASPGRRVVAYVLTKGTGHASTVFLVRPWSAPVAVYRAARGGQICAFPHLAWHGSWLLYTPHRGHAVLIDAAGSHRVIGLPAALPGSRGSTVRVQAVSWR